MNLLRRVLLVGFTATLIDVAGVLLLWELGWHVAPADAVAVAAATVASWSLHTLLGQPDAPSRKWFESPGPYWSTAFLALVADVAILWGLNELFDPQHWWQLLALKVVALSAAFLIRSNNYRQLMFASVRQEQSHPSNRPPAAGDYRLSVVIPAYMEADRIAATVERVRSELEGIAVEVVVVNDGSTDDTAGEARRGGADQVVDCPDNRGKGAAVRSGMLVARGRTIAFTDADLSYAPAQISGLLESVEDGWDVVVGSRKHTATLTVVRAGRLREFGGRLVNVFTGVVLLGGYRDTQCGLKAFRSDVARLIFGHTKVDGFAFDVEVFHLIERYRLSLDEVPVEVENAERSTVSVVRDTLVLVADLMRIRKWGRTGEYDATDQELPPSR
jgi:dolichyl-phosphate beta-glucosyltransferase